MGLFGPLSSVGTPPDPAQAARARTTLKRARPAALWQHPRALWIGLAAFGVAVAFTVAVLRSPSEGVGHDEARAQADVEHPESTEKAPPRATNTAARRPAPDPEPELSPEPPAAPEPTVRVARSAPKQAARPAARAPRERKPSNPAEL